MTPTRKLTVTLEITALPKVTWHLENGSIESTQGYVLTFPDKHMTWVDERDYEEYYLANSPTGLITK
jgi:hypothetical protein